MSNKSVVRATIPYKQKDEIGIDIMPGISMAIPKIYKLRCALSSPRILLIGLLHTFKGH
ncbi:hypothetical protein CLAVI_000452 [Candidatus Clavichlamydia salmonicola]|uniref:hypothetical protein n=1 Tax=Candidatus Clavichlamydia salmonicola TaxID=469812 RepID=UPI001891B3D6|nr:hypothetical protein [Candidatus Clavichlamydia salmonicola]MBF5050833.1 hypothetical protein [Candidatus Clavichlamydia salmonicola]